MIALVGALLLLEPLIFANEALAVFPTLFYRGRWAILELTAHGFVAAVCAAAGLGLINRTPAARQLGLAAVVAGVARVIQSEYWSVLPSASPPGQSSVVVGIAVLIGAAALTVIHRSTRSCR